MSARAPGPGFRYAGRRYYSNMKPTTITLPDDIEHALEACLDDQEVPLALTAVVETVLRDYLAEHGYLRPAHPLKITPAQRGSSKRAVSVTHDR